MAAILSYGIGRWIPTVALIWPGFGVGWFGTAGRPDDALAVVSFAHQRLQYEITQIVPLAVLLAIGVLFYVLGRATREQVVEVPLAAVPGAAPAR